jgi:3-methyladenine DNA glycosylase AlkD
MASPAAVAKAIGARLRALADPDLRIKYQRLVPGARVLGVSVPELRELAAQVRRDEKGLSLDDACAILDRFARAPVREHMLVGIILVSRFGRAVRAIDWSRIERWARSLDNWEACDQLASNVAAPVLDAHPELAARLAKLAASRNPWTRRFAVASAADLTHAGRGRVDVVFDICERLVDAPDPMIQTALGWALREASKADQAATLSFLETMKSRLPPRTLREAAKKMAPANRRRLLNERSLGADAGTP